MTTCESVTDGLYELMRSLPEGMLHRKRVLIAANCFPSLHFLLAGLAPKMGFRTETVPFSKGKAWVEASRFLGVLGEGGGPCPFDLGNIYSISAL